MPFDVFISHTSVDKTTAYAACAWLERAGIRCWIAPRNIRPDVPWAESIIEAIDQCRAMVLIFSSRANVSDDVQREVYRAFARAIPVLPLRIEDAKPTDTMAYFLDRVHWLDALTPPLDKNLQRLLRAVQGALET